MSNQRFTICDGLKRSTYSQEKDTDAHMYKCSFLFIYDYYIFIMLMPAICQGAIVQVSASTYHTVGLKNGGTVLVIGDGSYGQCDTIGWKLRTTNLSEVIRELLE